MHLVHSLAFFKQRSAAASVYSLRWAHTFFFFCYFFFFKSKCRHFTSRQSALAAAAAPNSERKRINRGDCTAAHTDIVTVSHCECSLKQGTVQAYQWHFHICSTISTSKKNRNSSSSRQRQTSIDDLAGGSCGVLQRN